MAFGNNYSSEYDVRSGMNQDPDKGRVAKRLYTTEMINSIRKDMLDGFVVDTTPFFPYNTDLRNANVTFKMTQEELEEYEKCFMDAGYFIEKYCKFLTDHGRRTVKLRDYQHEIVDMVTAQHYDPEYDEMLPDNQRVILLASRQIGKCFSGGETIQTTGGNVFVKDLYNRVRSRCTFLDKLKTHLLNIYIKL